jgi:hypothetical protein
MKAEIPWRKRKRGVHKLDESRNPVEQAENRRSLEKYSLSF